MHVVCPHCSAINRVPEERLQQHPQCGSCHQALFGPEPLALGDADFERFVARSELPLLVDFWAPWCGPCRTMAPQFEQAAQLLQGRAVLAKVNSDDNPQASVRHRIRSIPTLLLFRNGQEVRRHSGAMPAREIVRWAGL
ncbi:thioredoxin TrxC [Thiomonas sp. FB-6]|uniref:thioredoxin TrxC n=1 Tax=Thiomonas sp. FB-6 TaxID=1158291 RepID=UPI00035DE960|nr:thioredoxin TrxC [Thiomonas sp. FB-6]